jgi:hypothetical protein
MVHPIELHGSSANHESEIKLSIHLTQTVVRASAEDKPVLGTLHLCIARDPSLRVKVIRIWVDFGVSESWVRGRDDHGTWSSVSEPS